MYERSITVIPARIRLTSEQQKQSKPRVAAYARVSTEFEEQESSFEIQVKHYESYIKSREDWTFVKIYTDFGISGTTTKERNGFNEMMKDALDGKIDIILIKSISRFSRNTVDCLKSIRDLKERNVAVIFEKEGVNTLEATGEMMISILAVLSQQESQSNSDNVKLGIKHRFQNGEVMLNHKRFLGFDKDENKNLIIILEEAEIIRKIFSLYLEGENLHSIARIMMAEEVLTGAGKATWRPDYVKSILQNEKYMGDLLLQKTYTVDFLTKKRVKNTGIVPQYYVENNHEAIIPKDLFLKVQSEIARRSKVYSQKSTKSDANGRHEFTGKIICGECGSGYRRLTYPNKVVWKCVSRATKLDYKCNTPNLEELEIQNLIVKAFNIMIKDKEEFIEKLKNNILEVVNENLDDELRDLENKISEIEDLFITTSVNDSKYQELLREDIVLQDKRNKIIEQIYENENSKYKLEELLNFLEKQEDLILNYDEKLCRVFVEKIVVNKDHNSIKFRQNVIIEIK